MKKNLHLIIMWYNFLKMAKKKKRRKFYIDSQTEKTIVTIFAVSFILITTLIFNRVVAGKILKQVQKESRTDTTCTAEQSKCYLRNLPPLLR